MNRLMVFCGLFTCVALGSGAFGAASGFELKDTEGKHLDVLRDGKIVARYMYEYDKSTPEKRLETYKPYLHVFDAEGKAPITKGPGGQYTHHRGIFIGWSKISHTDKESGKKSSYDRWHMNNGEIVHQKFENQKAAADSATFTSVTHWNDAAGKPFVEEHRTMTFKPAPEPARLIIDFHSELKAVNGDVTLGGDPEHAGIHFRPAEKVSNATYVFPKEGAQPTKDLDYPWVGQSFTINGEGRHSVVHMNHPSNPKETKYSAYRDYGRFGAFPTAELKDGASRAFDYRFLIADGEMPAAEVIQKVWDEYAGVKEPTPAPKLTVTGKKPAAK